MLYNINLQFMLGYHTLCK